jgi:phytoene synthase
LNPQSSPLQKKTSFYYPLLLLPAEKRQGMESLYRFCWAADDIADNHDPLPVKKKNLAVFKKKLEEALSGKSRDPFFKVFQRTIERFQLSSEPLRRILQGIERDLKPVHFKKFSELQRYALQVAGGPGLASMEIFGFKDKAHREYAENLGVFLQIVNITRDYREDMALGRQYFPNEDFERFHLDPRSIGERNSHWKSFVDFQLNRAWTFYKKAHRSLSRRQQSELLTAEAMSSIYVKLHQKLKAHPHLILERRVVLSQRNKLASVLGAFCRCFLWKWAKD